MSKIIDFEVEKVRDTVIASGKKAYEVFVKDIKDGKLEYLGAYRNEYGELFVVVNYQNRAVIAGHETDWEIVEIGRGFMLSKDEMDGISKIVYGK